VVSAPRMAWFQHLESVAHHLELVGFSISNGAASPFAVALGCPCQVSACMHSVPSRCTNLMHALMACPVSHCPPNCLQRKLKAQRRELQSLAQIQVGAGPASLALQQIHLLPAALQLAGKRAAASGCAAVHELHPLEDGASCMPSATIKHRFLHVKCAGGAGGGRSREGGCALF